MWPSASRVLLQNVNLGLMRYDTDAEGGYVLAPVENIATNRDSIIKTLTDFDDYAGSGGTPLSETFYEASLYLQGQDLGFRQQVFAGDGQPGCHGEGRK